MRTLWKRAVGFLSGNRLDRDLDAEVGFHLDMLIAEQMTRGLSEQEARAVALRTFGAVTQIKEEYRDQRGLPWLDMFIQDTRYGARSLMRTPGFTLAALLTLALGIGANTAIFSVVNAVLLRPLPFPEPERIVQLGRMVKGASAPQINHDGRRYLYYRDHLSSADLAAWHGVGFNLAAGDRSEYVLGRAVSKEYFTVFGGQALFGRTIGAEHDVLGGPDVVVLSHPLWRRQFGSNPSILGTTVTLAERPYTVIGVMPEDFVSLPAVDLYIPLRPSTAGTGGGFNYTVAGRLRSGVTRDQANGEMQSLFEAFKRDFPKSVFSSEFGSTFVSYQDMLAEGVRPALLIMLGAVGTLLLIACANTANLLLARASGRGREVAVRAALGASRARIVRQLLTESVLLALTGAVVGLALAYWSVPALLALMRTGFNVYQDARIDATVLAATFAIAVVTGLLFGLAPAANLSRHELTDAFKDDGTRTTSNRRSVWLRRGLVVAEVGLCMLLLVGAGLLIQTFMKMRAIDPGFDLTGVITARMSLQGDRYASPAALDRFYTDGLDRIRRIPGVRAASVVNGIPIERGLNLNVKLLDAPEPDNNLIDWRYATPGYFTTMGIDTIGGRPFDESDRAGSPRVAVVNEAFARKFYGGENPVGRRIAVFEADGPIEIVGMVRDVREQGLVGPLPALMYVPVAQTSERSLRTTHAYFQVNWVVRAANPSAELTRAVTDAIRAVDPRQPISSFRTMEEVKGAQFQTERFQMLLLGLFAAIGLMLAAAGIYGLISYSVVQRTREFGIRIALGASAGQLVRSIVLQGALLALAGIAGGAAAAVIAARALQNALSGFGPIHPATFVIVGGLLMLVALAASLIPALRAVRLNPVAALRS